MCVPTAFALNTADTEAYFAGWRLDISVIVTMNRKAARVSTRACETEDYLSLDYKNLV